MEDLIIEAISIYGMDALYLPRRRYDVDGVLLEDQQHYFDLAVPVDVYLKNADRMGGQGVDLTQYGIINRDSITLTVARRTWLEAVGQPQGLPRPSEGDLVWFARNQRLFEVTYAERYSMMYPLGALPTWELRCELVEATSARFDTGYPEIDAFEAATSQDLLRFAVRDAAGAPLRTASGDLWVVDSRDEALVDPGDASAAIQRDADLFINFDETDPFSENAF